ncbi:MAG: hypothetical protein JXA24_04645 [Proteobacteria bacterium]|nr:hypothetical protein [Pseudomonadota bacterium]
MAFVKTRDQSQMQNRVGGSYGERRALSQGPAAQVQKPAASKPLDDFNRVDRRNMDSFAPNADFRKTAPAKVPGIPYKKSLHEHVERGTAPVSADAKAPSDRAILNFLDKVIAAEPQRPKAQSNVSLNSKPLNKVTPKAHRASLPVRPALPRSSRPIPSMAKTHSNKA